MKTHRLTILVTPAEKDDIGRQAAALGISASEFVRKAARLLDAEDIAALESIHALLPEFNVALDRMHENLAAALEFNLERHKEIANLRSPEYRKLLLEELLRGGRSEIAAAAALFGQASAEETAPESPPAQREDGTLFERMSQIARSAARSAAENETLARDPAATKRQA